MLDLREIIVAGSKIIGLMLLSIISYYMIRYIVNGETGDSAKHISIIFLIFVFLLVILWI
ncbi:MAG: hypothetical protein RXR32_02700 [Candidatus Micrarchaeota archaeon]